LVVNYARVTGLRKDANQKLCGAVVEDMEGSGSYEIRAKAIVNATGVFVDGILKMDNPSAEPSVVASQGIHVVVDRKFYPSEHALMIPETSDGRVLFAVPWHNEVVIGTTDTPVGSPSMEPRALEKEIEFVLGTAAGYMKDPPQRKDVLSVFAGLRPLAAPQKGSQKTKEISRSHKIMVSASHLFTIIGGKWTTFRKMGEDMMDQVEAHLNWPKHQATTANRQIHGFLTSVDWNDPLYYYGSDLPLIKKQMNGNANHWMSESLKIHEVQVRWAVRNEMARTVEDFLARRTRALLLDARESVRICEEVARIMADELKKDNDWIKQQVDEYEKLAKEYLLV